MLLVVLFVAVVDASRPYPLSSPSQLRNAVSKTGPNSLRLKGGHYGQDTVHEILIKDIWSTDASPNPPSEITVKTMHVDHLTHWLPDLQRWPNPCKHKGAWVGEDESVIDVIYVNSPRAIRKGLISRQWMRAGPKEKIYFDPTKVNAAIVTCGGLCPGLNNVIQSITFSLRNRYNVANVWGIQFGYKGFYSLDWMELTEESTRHIHTRGGTILGSSRGGHDLEKIMTALEEKGVNQVYVIGGDGTHMGANIISKEAARRKVPMSVCGVPKTIDNDVAFIDKSFGFDTAVGEAVKVINCALIEADDSHEGVGIVKLMGRECGFIAMYATLASNVVDICLIPEEPFELEELFQYAQEVIKKKGHCLIVVAEGAGQKHFEGLDLGKDPSGNKILPDIGTLLKNKCKDWFKAKGRPTEVRYIDPSYQIRSVPASPSDSVYCSALGTSVVHGAMAGLTGFSCGHRNNRYVYIPIDDMCDPSQKVRVDTSSRIYNRMVGHTGQPRFFSQLFRGI